MLQRGGGGDLLHEALGAQHGGQFGLEHLDRDLALVLEILGQVHGGHAALPELALEAVAVGEGGGEARGRIQWMHRVNVLPAPRTRERAAHRRGRRSVTTIR